MSWNNMDIWRVDPLLELNRLQRDMNRLFDGFGPRASSGAAVNVWSNEDEALVTTEVPGFKPEDLDISVSGDELLISGERHAEELPEDAVCHRSERGIGRFTRTVPLPFEVDSDKVKAALHNGILQVRLPRTETSKPRKIAVASE